MKIEHLERIVDKGWRAAGGNTSEIGKVLYAMRREIRKIIQEEGE